MSASVGNSNANLDRLRQLIRAAPDEARLVAQELAAADALLPSQTSLDLIEAATQRSRELLGQSAPGCIPGPPEDHGYRRGQPCCAPRADLMQQAYAQLLMTALMAMLAQMLAPQLQQMLQAFLQGKGKAGADGAATHNHCGGLPQCFGNLGDAASALMLLQMLMSRLNQKQTGLDLARAAANTRFSAAGRSAAASGGGKTSGTTARPRTARRPGGPIAGRTAAALAQHRLQNLAGEQNLRVTSERVTTGDVSQDETVDDATGRLARAQIVDRAAGSGDVSQTFEVDDAEAGVHLGQVTRRASGRGDVRQRFEIDGAKDVTLTQAVGAEVLRGRIEQQLVVDDATGPVDTAQIAQAKRATEGVTQSVDIDDAEAGAQAAQVLDVGRVEAEVRQAADIDETTGDATLAQAFSAGQVDAEVTQHGRVEETDGTARIGQVLEVEDRARAGLTQTAEVDDATAAQVQQEVRAVGLEAGSNQTARVVAVDEGSAQQTAIVDDARGEPVRQRADLWAARGTTVEQELEVDAGDAALEQDLFAIASRDGRASQVIDAGRGTGPVSQNVVGDFGRPLDSATQIAVGEEAERIEQRVVGASEVEQLGIAGDNGALEQRVRGATDAVQVGQVGAGGEADVAAYGTGTVRQDVRAGEGATVRADAGMFADVDQTVRGGGDVEMNAGLGSTARQTFEGTAADERVTAQAGTLWGDSDQTLHMGAGDDEAIAEGNWSSNRVDLDLGAGTNRAEVDLGSGDDEARVRIGGRDDIQIDGGENWFTSDSDTARIDLAGRQARIVEDGEVIFESEGWREGDAVVDVEDVERIEVTDGDRLIFRARADGSATAFDTRDRARLVGDGRHSIRELTDELDDWTGVSQSQAQRVLTRLGRYDDADLGRVLDGLGPEHLHNMMNNLSEDDRWVHGPTIERIQGVLAGGRAELGDARQTAGSLDETLAYRGIGWVDDGEARSAIHELSRYGERDLAQIVRRMDTDRLQHFLYDGGGQIPETDRILYQDVISQLERLVPRRD